ncbi:hypothetical protein [Thiobacillus sp.]|uniref:hypothetical protein n=1 Tax=Thiobacillus sp. TaxID=924 RepID=UPI0025E644AD|nr:hypothetical protein [Thiobacillus sp.]
MVKITGAKAPGMIGLWCVGVARAGTNRHNKRAINIVLRKIILTDRPPRGNPDRARGNKACAKSLLRRPLQGRTFPLHGTHPVSAMKSTGKVSLRPPLRDLAFTSSTP